MLHPIQIITRLRVGWFSTRFWVSKNTANIFLAPTIFFVVPIFWIQILNPDSEFGFWVEFRILNPNSEFGFWIRILNSDSVSESRLRIRIRIQVLDPNPDSESCSEMLYIVFLKIWNLRIWNFENKKVTVEIKVSDEL